MNRELWTKIDQFSDLPTPYYLFNGAYFLEDAKELYTGLCKHLPTIQINYSTKTNPLQSCLSIAKDLGFSFEVVGPDDLSNCLNLCIPGNRISLGGPSWSQDLVENALNKGVGQFICDSPSNALILLSALRSKVGGHRPKVGFRIHEGESHFGFSPTDSLIRKLAENFRQLGCSELGLHLHRNPGGSVDSVETLMADFLGRSKTLMSLADRIPFFSFFNLGGGIDSPWIYRVHPSQLGEFHNPTSSLAFREKIRTLPRFSLRSVGESLSLTIQQEILSRFPQAQIQMEPGRAFCTRALTAVLGVTAVKENFYPGHQVLITDGSTAALGPLHRTQKRYASSRIKVEIIRKNARVMS